MFWGYTPYSHAGPAGIDAFGMTHFNLINPQVGNLIADVHQLAAELEDDMQMSMSPTYSSSAYIESMFPPYLSQLLADTNQMGQILEHQPHTSVFSEDFGQLYTQSIFPPSLTQMLEETNQMAREFEQQAESAQIAGEAITNPAVHSILPPDFYQMVEEMEQQILESQGTSPDAHWANDLQMDLPYNISIPRSTQMLMNQLAESGGRVGRFANDEATAEDYQKAEWGLHVGRSMEGYTHVESVRNDIRIQEQSLQLRNQAHEAEMDSWRLQTEAEATSNQVQALLDDPTYTGW